MKDRYYVKSPKNSFSISKIHKANEKTKNTTPCSCGHVKKEVSTMKIWEKDGVNYRIRNIPTWVCAKCGDSFYSRIFTESNVENVAHHMNIGVLPCEVNYRKDLQECLCAGMTYFTTKDLTETLEGKQIVVKNFPHWKCLRCGHFSYSAGHPLIGLLCYAVDHNWTEIDFNKLEKYKADTTWPPKDTGILSYNCDCGGTLNYTTEPLNEKYKERMIVVNDFPHHICSNCGNYEFNIDDDLNGCLKYAYEQNLDNIDFIYWLKQSKK